MGRYNRPNPKPIPPYNPPKIELFEYIRMIHRNSIDAIDSPICDVKAVEVCSLKFLDNLPILSLFSVVKNYSPRM